MQRDPHELGEELAVSHLYQVHLYHWLESNDHGRFLTDNDLQKPREPLSGGSGSLDFQA